MQFEGYEYGTEATHLYYEFFSEGPKGRIRKIVEYAATSLPGVYNLSFGDYDEATNHISHKSITNNGDSQKILATVAATVYAFTERHPEAWIYATGTTAVRTRLYRMGLTTNLSAIAENFHVFGLRSESWEPFVCDINYNAFLIRRKVRNFEL